VSRGLGDGRAALYLLSYIHSARRVKEPRYGPASGPSRAVVRSAGVEPAASSISGWSLCQLEYEHMRAPDPIRAGGLSLTRRPLLPTELQGRDSCQARTRTLIHGSRGAAVLPVRRPGNE
jgi:hypothetical protein